MRTHHIRGLEISLPGAPRQVITPGNSVARVAVFASDHPGLVPHPSIAEGHRVVRGDTLFTDRRRRELRVTAPAAGRVLRVVTGARLRLSHVEIAVDGQDAKSFDIPGSPTREDMAQLCLESGLWTSFLQRPFGKIPDPGDVPAAIFVTATETDPLCAEAAVVLARFEDAFRAGVRGLGLLTDGPVFICQGEGSAVADADDQVRVERFRGPHPAGLPGTHIDRIWAPGSALPVWQVRYQDVIALGEVLTTGMLPETRVVAMAGPGVRDPRLVEVPLGAALDEVLNGEIRAGEFTTLSGSPLSGRESSHLRRRHWQISVLHQVRPAKPPPGWWARRTAALRSLPVIPTQALECALGPRLEVVPLVRALSAGDAETADRLGCKVLLEDDLDLASFVCGGRPDLGALLRQTLDTLEYGG